MLEYSRGSFLLKATIVLLHWLCFETTDEFKVLLTENAIKYKKITKTEMRKAIKKVYKDMPQLLKEALEWFEKNWMK